MASELLQTGNAGFDTILNGGLPSNRIYLVQGDPGVGKTGYLLSAGSVLVDAGVDVSTLPYGFAVTRDVQGEARPNGTADIGADEFYE